MDKALNSTGTLETLTLKNSTRRDRFEVIEELRTRLRPGQRDLAQWQGGSLAVSAVPGAGKSTGMAVGAAVAIARYQLHPKRLLVVVTFTRSAAAGIKAKIRDYLQELCLPLGSFVVQTLHGLALNIATRHRELSGLDLEAATLITPNQSHRLLKACVERWIIAHPHHYQSFLEGINFDGEETERLRRQTVLRGDVLPALANTAIREAKSSGLTPEDLENIAADARDDYRILQAAAGLYGEYEKALRSRDFIDYDDMILAALRVLDRDNIRQQWQRQVFAVFEDEAQDSSPLQAKLLSILAADADDPEASPNLVRVGDPNQAINSTFTPADPLYFNWFCEICQSQKRLATMECAGRSTRPIIDAANYMLWWVNSQASDRPQPEITPFRLQYIHPVAAEDPQPNANPEAVGGGLELYTPDDIYHTVELIRDRVLDLFTDNREASAAILVRENRQGRFLASQLEDLQKQHEIRVYEVSEVERHSHIPEEILKLLRFLDRPHSPENLKTALEVLARRDLIPQRDFSPWVTLPEQFLYPTPLDPPAKPAIKRASRYCANLLRARLELPEYHLISFLGLTLNYTGSELATVQKLADRITCQTQGNSSLQNAIAALEEIVTSEQFEGVEEETEDRYTLPGQLTIITMHKAKGLDWDYVFLPFLHEDLIPGKPWVPTGAKFLGDFTLSEVARTQIRAAVHSQYLENTLALPEPLEAWEQAMQLKKAEEYRLLYVAMTRAKRLLWMSAAANGPFRWSSFNAEGAGQFQTKTSCPVLTALRQKFPQAIRNEEF